MAFDGTLKFDTKLDSSGLNSGMSKLGSLASSGFKAVTKIVGAAAAGVTAFGASALKAGGDFSAGMSKVEAIAGDALVRDMDSVTEAAKQLGLSFDSGASDAEKAMQTLEAQALKTASTSTFTAGEVSQALTYMGMAGWDTGQMLGGLQGVIDLAEASGEDLATTSDIVTDAMTAFGMVAGQTSTVLRNGTEVELENTARFVDVLSAAASSSNTNVALMGETFKYVAPVAGSMGYSIEETAQAIGLMANQGIKGSQAGTALRNILTNMTEPTDQMAIAMQELGISLDDGEGNMLSLMDVMYQLREGFKGLKLEDTELIDRLSELDAQYEAGSITQKEYEGEVDRLIDLTYGAEGAMNAQYAAMMAGKYGMSGLLAIVNTSDEDFEALAQSIADSEGRASEMAATMKDNLPGALKMANSALDILKVKLEQSIEGPAKDAVLAVTDMINGMTDAFDQGGLEGLATAAGESIAGIAQMIMEAAPTIINTAVSIIHSFCESLKSQDLSQAGTEVVTALVNGILTVSGVLLSTAGVLFMQLIQGIAPHLQEMLQTGIDIILNLINGISQAMPTLIPLAIQVIMQLVQGLINNLPAILDAALQLVQALVQGILDAIPVLIAALPDIITGIVDFLVGAIPQITDTVIHLLMGIIEAIPTIIEALVVALPDIIEALISGLMNARVNLFTASIDLFCALIEAIPEVIVMIIENLPTIITAIVQGLVQAIPKLLEASIRMFGALVQAIPKVITSMIKALPDILKCILVVLTNGLPMIIDIGKQLFHMIVEQIPQCVAELKATVPEIWNGIVNSLKEGLVSVKNAAIELGQSILGGIKEFFGIHSLITVMQEQGDYIVDGMMNSLAEMPGKMTETLTQTVENVLQWGQDLSTKMGIAMQTAVTNVITALSQLPGRVWTFLTDIITKVIQWAAQLLNNMRTAATNAINAVVQLFSQFPGKVWTWLQNIITKVIQWAAQLLNNMRTAAMNAINAVVQLFSQFPGQIWTWLQNVITKVIQWASQLLSQMAAAATNAINRVVQIFQELPGKIQTILTNVITKVIQWASDMASKASSAATGFVNALVNGLSGLPGKMVEIGSNIVRGIWNGISSGWDWLTGKVKDLANSLLSAAKDALGINSPSKVFADEVGVWIPPGIGKGFEKTMPKLESGIEEQMKALANKMQAKVIAETGTITLRHKAEAEHTAETERKSGDTITYDNHIEQENTYNIPVATPSKVAKSQREAARKLLGGVK